MVSSTKLTSHHNLAKVLLKLPMPSVMNLMTNLDVFHLDTTPTFIQELDEPLGMLTFLIRILLEELVETWQSDIIPFKVACLQHES